MTTVLIVDDSAVDRKLVSGLLPEEPEWNLLYAGDGEDALQQLSTQVPDLVLTDLQMPKMNGLDLVSAVKANYPFVPVILMTAHGSEEVAAEALRIGAASYVPKRRIAEDLVDTVQRVLAASEQNRSQVRLMHYLEQNDSVFVLGNDLSLIGWLVEHVEQMLRCTPLGDEIERVRVGIALEEALRNAYFHGNCEVKEAAAGVRLDTYEETARQRRAQSPYRDRRIHVEVNISRSQVRFVVRDEGPGFDVSECRVRPEVEESEDDVGRGIMLMRTIMDEVDYSDNGNMVTLIKRPVVGEAHDGDADTVFPDRP